jgi:tetratricopeptide (TPR) repeat protein
VDKLFIKVSENQLLDRPDLEPVRKELLETSLAYYRDFVRRSQDDPELPAELAASHLRFAQIENAMELGLGWVPHFQSAVDIVEQLIDENTIVARYGTLRQGIYRGRGRILRPRSAEEAAAALRAFQQARDVWTKLVKIHPDEDGFQNDLAGFYNVIGVFLTKAQPDAAIESLEKARGIWENLGHKNPENFDYQSDLAKTWNNIGNAHAQSGNLDEALSSFGEAVRIQLMLVQKDPVDTYFQTDLGSTYYNVGKLQAKGQLPTEAYDSLQKSLAIRQKLARDYPLVSHFQYLLGTTHQELGSLHDATGQAAEAHASYEQARDVFQKLVADDSTNQLYQGALKATLTSLARGRQ